MSGELNKDIFFLSITNAGIILFHTWTIIYPYYASYMHSVNPDITANIVFAGLIFFFIGNIIGNIFNQYSIRVIGFKNNMYIAALLTLYFAYMVVKKFTVFYVFFA